MSEVDEWEEIPTEDLAEGTLVEGEMMVQEWAVRMRDPQYSLQQQGVYRDQHAQMQKCLEALRSQLLPVEVAARKRLREAEDKELEDDALKAGIAASLITAQDEELATMLALSTKAVPEEASDPAWRGSAEPELVSRQDFRPRAAARAGGGGGGGGTGPSRPRAAQQELQQQLAAKAAAEAAAGVPEASCQVQAPQAPQAAPAAAAPPAPRPPIPEKVWPSAKDLCDQQLASVRDQAARRLAAFMKRKVVANRRTRAQRWKAGDRVRLVGLQSIAACLNGKTGVVTDTRVSTLGSSDQVRVKLVGLSHAWYAPDNLEPV